MNYEPRKLFFLMLLLVFSCPEAFEFPFISKCLEGDHCILLDHACWYSSICLLVLLWFFFYVCWIFNVENIGLLLLISKKWWLLVALKKIIVTFSIGQKLIWRELSGFHVDFSNQVVFVRLSVGQETCDMNRRGCFCEDTYKINPPDKNSTVNFTRCVDTQKSRQSSVC